MKRRKTREVRKVRLLKDVVIPKGTVFAEIDGDVVEYEADNFGTIVGLSNNTCGEFVYCIDPGFSNEMAEWFEEVADEQ